MGASSPPIIHHSSVMPQSGCCFTFNPKINYVFVFLKISTFFVPFKKHNDLQCDDLTPEKSASSYVEMNGVLACSKLEVSPHLSVGVLFFWKLYLLSHISMGSIVEHPQWPERAGLFPKVIISFPLGQENMSSLEKRVHMHDVLAYTIIHISNSAFPHSYMPTCSSALTQPLAGIPKCQAPTST